MHFIELELMFKKGQIFTTIFVEEYICAYLSEVFHTFFLIVPVIDEY